MHGRIGSRATWIGLGGSGAGRRIAIRWCEEEGQAEEEEIEGEGEDRSDRGSGSVLGSCPLSYKNPEA